MKVTRKNLLGNSFQEKQLDKIGKEKRRRFVLLVFLITISSCLLFWLKNKGSNWWEELKNPVIYEILGEKENEDWPVFKTKEEVLKEINTLVSSLRGTYGIFFYDLTNNEALGINEDQIFTAASVNKVPIMVSFYQEVEKGSLKEDQEYVLKKADIQDYGTGTMRYQEVGTKYPYSKLVNLSGKISDNTAAHVLQEIISFSKIKQNLAKLKMEQTSLEDNTTTPKEMGEYFAKLYNNNLIGEEHKKKIYDALIKTDFEDRIPKGVPEHIKVAHKIGNEVQIYNDCGIVFASNPYVLCVLTKEVAEAEALEVIPKISKVFFGYSLGKN